MSSDKPVEKKEEEKVELDIVALPSDEVNPMQRPFEQTVKIEWKPAELVFELAQRNKAIEDLTKERDSYDPQIAVHQRHVTHLERILNLPEVKVLVDAEAEYLKSTAVDEAVADPKVAGAEEVSPDPSAEAEPE